MKKMCKHEFEFGRVIEKELKISSESVQFPIKSETLHLTDIIKEESESEEIKPEEVFIKEEVDTEDRVASSPLSNFNMDTISTQCSESELTVGPQSQRLLECNHCGLRTNRNSYFEQHMNIHTNKRPFKCDKCNFQTAWKMSLKKHMMIHASNEVPSKYNILDSCNSQWKHSLEGYKTTHDKEFKYSKCSFITGQTHTLCSTRMINSVIDLPFKCDKCSYKNLRKRYLQQHMITQHGEKPFECDICGFKTAWSGNLQLHRKIHTEGKFFMKCSKCNYRTTVKQNYEMHIPLHTD